jgi:predicted metal-binding membrane protein
VAGGVAASRAQRAVLAGAAAAVTLAAWLWLARTPGHGMLCPAHAALDARGIAASVAMWQAMMIAMMTPTVLRWVFAFASLGRPAGTGTLAFGAGYFTVWLGYSVVAAALQAGLQQTGFLEMSGKLPARAGGGVLIAAGLVYFTPLSRACLKHCRNPLTYFITRWNNGPPGGFRVGLTHGGYCVGCCWAVMATGFAMGIMNMAWMAALALLMCVEKLAPGGERIGAAAALGMGIWGGVLLL